MNQGRKSVTKEKPLFDTFEIFLNSLEQPERAQQILRVADSGNDNSSERCHRIWTLFHRLLTGTLEEERYRLSLTNLQQRSYDIIGNLFRRFGRTYSTSLVEALQKGKEALDNDDRQVLVEDSDMSYSLAISTLFELEMESSAQWQSENVMADLSRRPFRL